MKVNFSPALPDLILLKEELFVELQYKNRSSKIISRLKMKLNRR